ncbi:MAG: hypothetical protein H0V18_10145 [Pyrinomonadaceae bacterium]|nr:hypothetical protein [Pyrinomonadaceae bacterium]
MSQKFLYNDYDVSLYNDYDVSGFEGLSLLNGTYRGRTAIGKFSMPAIRVKYLVDGGFLDWRRPLRKGAGPYADRLRWKLGGLYGLQRISNRNNQYVGFNSYINGGMQWMELSIYGRIGAYHISQQWHLSEDGWLAARVWSKGRNISRSSIAGSGVPSGQRGTAFVPVRRQDLDLVFSLQHERVVTRDKRVRCGDCCG